MELSDDALRKLAEIQKAVGGGELLDTPEAAAEFCIAAYHSAHIDDTTPDGWRLNDDLALEDMEAYFKLFSAEDGGNQWSEAGRALRAARATGWILEPAGLSERDIARMKPALAARLRRAIERHYVRLTFTDPN